jgi:hypothetical protein
MAPPPSDRWVFVTGMIRSGTTFVGTVLSLPLQVDYIHEPFNGGYSLPEREPFVPRYMRPGSSEPRVESYRSHLAKLFRYEFDLPMARNPRDPRWRRLLKSIFGSRGPVCLRLAQINPFHRSTILKDPVGKLVAEYLHVEFGVRPVVTVRHPASLAASLRRMEWWPEMSDFRRQESLIKDHFQNDRDFLWKSWDSPMLESMAHWRATYKVLLRQAKKHDWIVLTHEEVSERPVETFKSLYDTLGLPWSPAIKWTIKRFTSGDNSASAAENQAMDMHRDSSAIFELRRDSLDMETRRKIFDITSDVALDLYSRQSFALD